MVGTKASRHHERYVYPSCLPCLIAFSKIGTSGTEYSFVLRTHGVLINPFIVKRLFMFPGFIADLVISVRNFVSLVNRLRNDILPNKTEA